ncbi:hypothetical protein FNU79_11960 [Deinococcus detaillensis]|uniref:Uncharacterized protein n=1 Tax=Deinococcus detaillensis TaxID=2592048 RepID=A0A553UU37_9DEIO|nr:hypothetical protein [Deinococcus detaillensis]TSA83714.1 hypothetical protein FNU79_11960 [Deinococcus detaillensis]
MKKKFGLLALTGIIALASCSQGSTPTVSSYDLTVKLTGDLSSGSFTASGTETTTINVAGGTGSANLKKGTYTVTAPTVTGYTFAPTSQSVDLTTSVKTVTFTSTKNAGPIVVPVTSAVLTIDLEGVTKAPVTIKDSKGAVVAGYNNVVVTDNEKITLPKDAYTIIAGDVANFTAPTGSVAANLTSGDATAKLTYTAVGTPAALGSIKISSPANGATVPFGSTQVTFAVTGTLTGVVCTVNGVNVNANVAASGGLCSITLPDVAGPAIITVSGKDANNAAVSDSVVVNVTPSNTNPTTGAIQFDPAQQIILGADGTVDDSKNDATDITARVFTNNGWRDIGQGLSTGANPSSDVYTYVKGTVNVNYAASAGTTKVEVLLARTTGTDVPTNDDIQAADVLNVDVNPAGTARTVTTSFDSTKLGEFQAVPEWLVVRVNSTQVFFRRVVADNTAPQPARPDFEGAKQAGSNVIRNFRGIQNNNFARGKIDVFTTNRDLQDQPFGRAPVTSTVAQLRPSGFESIRYFLVPSALVDVTPGLRDSDGVRLAKTIRFAFKAGNLGVIASAPQLAIGEAKDFRTIFNSTKSTTCTAGAPTTTPSIAGSITADPATTIAAEGKYRLYALTRDQIGNEAASPEYQVVTFDNVGPNVSNIAVRDVSPLPFPSTNPYKYISDVAAIGGKDLGPDAGKITDVGIGFDLGMPFHVDIGSLKIAVGTNGAQTVNGLLNSITIPPTSFDTNPIGDGAHTVNYNSFTDALGNLPLNCAPASVIIDNTDPTVTFNRFTATGVVESGSPQSIETLASDATSGVYANLLFWNDYTTKSNIGREQANRSRDNGFVGAPVEIQRVYKGLELTAGDGSQQGVGNNATWNALYPAVSDQGIQPMNINVVVVDRAGNATVLTRGVQVIPRSTNTNTGGFGGGVGLPIPFNIPSLGLSDGYRFDRAANLGLNSGRFITPVNTNNTTLADAGKPLIFPLPGQTLPSEDAVLSLAVNGTATNNGFIVTTSGGTSTGYDKLNSVTGFGGYDRTDWGKVLTYLNSKPSTATINTFQLGDPSLVRQNGSQAIVFDSNLFQIRADSRNLNDGFFANDNSASTTPVTVLNPNSIPTAAPWLKLGDLSTANQFYKVNSDLLNNLFWTRGYDSSTYSYLNVDGINDPTDANQVPLKAVYDEITGIVTDTAGAYNFYGEKTGR